MILKPTCLIPSLVMCLFCTCNLLVCTADSALIPKFRLYMYMYVDIIACQKSLLFIKLKPILGLDNRLVIHQLVSAQSACGFFLRIKLSGKVGVKYCTQIDMRCFLHHIHNPLMFSHPQLSVAVGCQKQITLWDILHLLCYWVVPGSRKIQLQFCTSWFCCVILTTVLPYSLIA